MLFMMQDVVPITGETPAARRVKMLCMAEKLALQIVEHQPDGPSTLAEACKGCLGKRNKEGKTLVAIGHIFRGAFHPLWAAYDPDADALRYARRKYFPKLVKSAAAKTASNANDTGPWGSEGMTDQPVGEKAAAA
jgi:hypothetical protein